MATGTLPAVVLPKFDSPLEIMAKRAELARYEDTSRLSNLASQRAYRINDLQRESGGDQKKLSELMSKDTDYQVAEEGRKMKEALGKASAEQLDQITKQMKFTGQVLYSANEQSWGQSLGTLNQAGVDTSNYPQTYDPAFVKRFAESTLEYDKVVDNIRADKQMEQTQGNADRTFDQTVKQNNATNARGWATINKDKWVYDPGRGIQINTATGESRPITASGTPIGAKGEWSNDLTRGLQINSVTGETRPITTGGAPVGNSSKAEIPSESERNAAYNTQRIISSAKTIKNVTSKDGGALSPGALEAAAASFPGSSKESGAANIMRSEGRQKVYQAQVDIIDSLLFLATGAAYNKEQLEQQRQSYLPQFTDKEGAVTEKASRLNNLVKAARDRSGRAWTPAMQKSIDELFPVSGVEQAGTGTTPDNPAQTPTAEEIEAELRRRGVIK